VRLLRAYGRELPKRAFRPSVVVELGAGSGEKAREILPYFISEQSLTYCPIDLSTAALLRCQRDLDDLPGLKTVPIEDSYVRGLASASKLRIPGTSIIVLFLGSSIGNFEPHVAEKFLTAVRGNLATGDVFLLSTDLVKPVERMLPAYDDALGLTSAFNLNLLARINRELDADFDLKKFQHEARYDAAEQRIEMHLRSTERQKIHINHSFSFELQKGETIWTESSYKFRPEQVRFMAERAGFTCECQWTDSEWPFAQSFLRAV
jgi:L-histidine N-alpha-methyltransferase